MCTQKERGRDGERKNERGTMNVAERPLLVCLPTYYHTVVPPRDQIERARETVGNTQNTGNSLRGRRMESTPHLTKWRGNGGGGLYVGWKWKES